MFRLGLTHFPSSCKAAARRPISRAGATRLVSHFDSRSPSGSKAKEQEVFEANAALLQSISAGDWGTYASLCDEGLTGFEPEAAGQQISGLPFHKFYFDMAAGADGAAASPAPQSTMCTPVVRVMGQTAVVSYARATQSVDAGGVAQTSVAHETRVWQRSPQDGSWKHVHVHRSPA
jgi:ketosteroid isomerase-like protein